MMNYESFKKVVAETFMSYLPERYQGMEMRIIPVKKVNRVCDGITLVNSNSKEKCNVSPTVYVNDMYASYFSTGEFQEVLQDVAKSVDEAFTEAQQLVELKFEDAKNNIVFQVINTLQNEDLLKEVPHREFLDLSIVYRWILRVGKEGIQSSVVQNNLAEKLGMGEEQLFKYAMENTRRILPPIVRDINEVICSVITDSQSKNAMNQLIDMMPEADKLWIISNEVGVYGAAVMLYDAILDDLASRFSSDIYVLPSSVHECIVVSARILDPYKLAEVVSGINSEQVELEERLSNQVYHYSVDNRKLTLATDTPNKRLD